MSAPLPSKPFIDIVREVVRKIQQPLLLYGIAMGVMLVFLLVVGREVPSGLLPIVYGLLVLIMLTAIGHFALEYIDRRPTFAFVPPDWYHVTLLNRAHFDVTALSSITMMTENERRLAQDVIAKSDANPIMLHLNGLILTSTGRLIVPGFPSDDRMYELRSRLVEELPQLQINAPITAHIKLGHVLTKLNLAEFKKLLDYVALYEEHTSARLTFDDVYTPLGRIPIVGGQKYGNKQMV